MIYVFTEIRDGELAVREDDRDEGQFERVLCFLFRFLSMYQNAAAAKTTTVRI